jgi:alginate O-acetyltransferase complex protein AlgJ
MNPIPNIKRWADLMLVGIFALALSLPAISSLCQARKKQSLDEYRMLAAFPEFGASTSHWQVYARQFERYYDDHFGGRESLIAIHLRIERALSPWELGFNTLVGRDGWLYYSGEGMIDHHRGITKFTRRQLQTWQLLLERRRDWLAAQGIKYLFVIAPNKESIYPEHLPGWLKPLSATKLDQFIGYMQVHSTVEILDLRPALWEARQPGPVYYKTDTHWNLMGAYVAYGEIIAKVSHQIPGLVPVAPENFSIQPEHKTGGDLARLIGEPGRVEDNACTFVPKKQLPQLEFQTLAVYGTDTNQLEVLFTTTVATTNRLFATHAMVFGDSFANALKPFLGYNFGKVNYREEAFDPKAIQEDMPVLVINEMVERYLENKDPGLMLKQEDLDAH